MNWLIFLDDFLQLAWMLSDPSQNQNGCLNQIEKHACFEFKTRQKVWWYLWWAEQRAKAKEMDEI